MIGFVVAGTQKGGTTALDSYLRQNPEIQMPWNLRPWTKKELHFFDNDNNFKNKTVSYWKYHIHFFLNRKKLAGDITPIYMYWHSAPERIWNYNPAMKFIIVLRNPIERAYSHWNMIRDRGVEKKSFLDAIDTEISLRNKHSPLQDRVYSYIDRGMYSEQLKRIWQFFPKNQVLILKNENLKYHLPEALDEIASFLEIRKFFEVEHQIIHARPYISTMNKEEFNVLNNIYSSEIENIESLLDWDCSEWLEFK